MEFKTVVTPRFLTLLQPDKEPRSMFTAAAAGTAANPPPCKSVLHVAAPAAGGPGLWIKICLIQAGFTLHFIWKVDNSRLNVHLRSSRGLRPLNERKFHNKTPSSRTEPAKLFLSHIQGLKLGREAGEGTELFFVAFTYFFRFSCWWARSNLRGSEVPAQPSVGQRWQQLKVIVLFLCFSSPAMKVWT